MEYRKTFRELFQNPGDVIESFVFERETKFQHPFSFGLIGVAIIILLNTFLVNFEPALHVGGIGSETDQMTQLNYWISFSTMKASTQFLPLTMFILFIPSLTLPGLFFFRDDIEGFYFNFILNSYAVGASVLALLVMIPLWLINDSTISNTLLRTYLPVVLTGIFIIKIYEKYFQINDIKGWIRIMSSYVTGCLIFFLLERFSAAIIGYFIFAVNRFLDIWMTV